MKNAIRGLVAALALLAVSAQSQVFFNMTVITNQQSAMVLYNFLPQTNFANQLMIPHSLLLTNVYTNEPIWVAYGAQIAGQTGTNVVQLAYVFTNYTATWVTNAYGAMFGSGLTNQFSVVINFPQQSLSVPTIPWAVFSNGPTTSQMVFTNGVVFQ